VPPENSNRAKVALPQKPVTPEGSNLSGKLQASFMEVQLLGDTDYKTNSSNAGKLQSRKGALPVNHATLPWERILCAIKRFLAIQPPRQLI